MKATFVISGRLAGLNEIIKAARGRAGWYSGAKQKKQMTTLCAYAIRWCAVPKFIKPVRLIFRWVEGNNRRDVDNIAGGAKFICDALVETERIPDDSRRWVKEIIHQFPNPNPDDPHISVTIEEIDS